MSRVYAFVAVLAAAGLAVPALASINYNASKSNTGNNVTFKANCKSQHGTVVTDKDGSSCKLASPKMNEPHWVPPALAQACTKDGGKATANNGVVECDHPTGMAAGKRTH